MIQINASLERLLSGRWSRFLVIVFLAALLALVVGHVVDDLAYASDALTCLAVGMAVVMMALFPVSASTERYRSFAGGSGRQRRRQSRLGVTPLIETFLPLRR